MAVVDDHQDRDDHQEWEDRFYCAQDGLRLYARHYRADAPAEKRGRSVLCLPGLTRNSKDFHRLAKYLAHEAPRRRDVYAIDYRGRGRSAYDDDWHNYTPYIELLDTLDFMTLAGLHDAAIVGTSRGGIIAMLMAVVRPTAIGVAVLNDIGPVLDSSGLARIAGYVGKIPTPASWDEATSLSKSMNQAFFPAVPDEDWTEIARQWFDDQNGQPVPDYDASLANAFGDMDLTKAPPEMWPQFTALSRSPTLVVRGEKSDLLSEHTVERMEECHDLMRSVVAKGEGHAPLLRDTVSCETISEFLEDTDTGAH